ncbi:hypothetical protein BH10ACI1_BH10ACI1_29430 [soil metagenome]
MTLVEDANTNVLNEITSSYLEEFQDKETRHIYVDEFLKAKIATQLKVLREQNGWSQYELAEKTGMKQERISVLEDVNYSAWTLHTLRRLAEAFDLRIDVSFEDFGSFLKEFANFNRESLERTSFEKDLVFNKDNKIKGKVLRTNKFAPEPIEQQASGHFTLNYLAAVDSNIEKEELSVSNNRLQVAEQTAMTLAKIA